MLSQINPVLGDYSAVAFGMNPGQLDEVTRIQTHLHFVCRFLELADIQHLSPSQQASRRRLIQTLQEYAEAREFPQREQDDFGPRRPRFIDHRGVHCAVGHLIASTDGADLPEQINALHEYDCVPDIEMEAVAQWMEVNGLSLLECTMIQPWYYDPLKDCPYLALAPGNDLEIRADAVRRFRDQRLQRHAMGRKLIQAYYKVGPGMVRFMENHPWSQAPVRRTLLMVTKNLK